VLKTAYPIDYWKNFYMTTNRQKEVGIDKQRKHTLAIAKLYLGRKTMAKQAKTLTQQELRRVLDTQLHASTAYAIVRY